MEKKPNKKEELTLVNNVLKLATKLLKVKIKLKMDIASVGYAILTLYRSLLFAAPTLCLVFMIYPDCFQITFEHTYAVYILLLL